MVVAVVGVGVVAVGVGVGAGVGVVVLVVVVVVVVVVLFSRFYSQLSYGRWVALAIREGTEKAHADAPPPPPHTCCTSRKSSLSSSLGRVGRHTSHAAARVACAQS